MSFYSRNYLVVPAGSMYVVFSSVTHFPAAMTCKKKRKKENKGIDRAAYCNQTQTAQQSQ